MTRAAAALAVLALVASSTTACASAMTVQTCVSWVGYADAQEMYDESVLVIAGTTGPADGQLRLFSGPADRHMVAIDEVYKGELDSAELWAAAHRDYCVADPPQPAEDPIPTDARVLLFLRPASEDPTAAAVPLDLDDVAAWSTLTPLAGVLPFPEGAELPFEPEP